MSQNEPSKQFDLAIFNASLAEKTERYEDMVEYMRDAIRIKTTVLSDIEKNLFSAAYKNLITPKRQALRLLAFFESDSESKNPVTHQITKEFRLKIEVELEIVCNEVAAIVDNDILPKCIGDSEESNETRVFFNKMKGDYFRYLAENKDVDNRDAAAEKACTAYEMAKEQAESLPETSSSRIGLLLNYSVFLYEIRKNTKGACEMAQSALKLGEDDNDADSENNDIKRLLHDNLQAWNAQTEQENEDTTNEIENETDDKEETPATNHEDQKSEDT